LDALEKGQNYFEPKEDTNEIAESCVHHRINDVARTSEIEDTQIKQEMNEKIGINSFTNPSSFKSFFNLPIIKSLLKESTI